MGTYPHWTHVIMGSSYNASPNDGVFRNASHRYSEGDLYFDFRNGNYKKFKNYIKSKNWEVLLQQKSSDEMWTVFKTILNDGINKFSQTSMNKEMQKTNVV